MLFTPISIMFIMGSTQDLPERVGTHQTSQTIIQILNALSGFVKTWMNRNSDKHCLG
jgi:hypothetical protein